MPPEEVAEKWSAAWVREQVAEIRRWAHEEHMPGKAEVLERNVMDAIIRAIAMGHPYPQKICRELASSLDENFPRQSRTLDE